MEKLLVMSNKLVKIKLESNSPKMIGENSGSGKRKTDMMKISQFNSFRS